MESSLHTRWEARYGPAAQDLRPREKQKLWVVIQTVDFIIPGEQLLC